jgi:citrate synthase
MEQPMTDATDLRPSPGDARSAAIQLPDGDVQLPVVTGTENERGLDISQLRAQTGFICLDPGYVNTGSCQSDITYISGEEGILRYRGYPIEQLARHSSFIETAYLLIWGELPTADQLESFKAVLTEHELLHEGLRHHFEGFPPYGHPMAILSAMINASGCYHPDMMIIEDETTLPIAAAKLISKVRTIAAFSYKKSIGQPFIYPDPHRSYCNNFLHMMFSLPYDDYEPEEEVVRALSLFLILHADHEQNCSTSTVRMVGSSRANLAASIAAGVCALWGPLHGGANMAVIEMLQRLHDDKVDLARFVADLKDDKERLMGFGHRVYKNFDPRAKILKEAADNVLENLGVHDPLLDIAKHLEEVALNDPFFLERKLYPNVDLYSGVILRAIGIPLNMFTVMFAIGRLPGWIAHWWEQTQTSMKISRPRQIYTGLPKRDYTPMTQR